MLLWVLANKHKISNTEDKYRMSSINALKSKRQSKYQLVEDKEEALKIIQNKWIYKENIHKKYFNKPCTQ